MTANREWSWTYAATAMFLGGMALALPVTAHSGGVATMVAALKAPRKGEIAGVASVPRLHFTRDPFAVPPGESVDDVRNGSENALIVRAIALGEHPAALVGVGGRTLVVTVGDRLAGSTVTRITAMALTLANGTRIALAEDKF